MALRQRITDCSNNQENINSNYAVKSNEVTPVTAMKNRATLAELGNILPSIQKNNALDLSGTILERHQSRLPIVNAECLPESIQRPLALFEKATVAVPPTKETIETPHNVPEEVTKADKSSKMNPVGYDVCKTVKRDNTESYSLRQPKVTDDCSKNDPTMVSEHVVDIFSYLKTMETKFPIREGFLDNHETTPWMRAKLVDWLVGVHNYFNLYSESLQLCVAIVDEYLQSNTDVGSDTLQLVGISALLVSSKYEEVRVPKLRLFEYICAYSYSRKQILAMEKDILKQVDFRLGRALPVLFLWRFNKIAKITSDHYWLGIFILDLALLENELSNVKPSVQAAAACCLTMGIMEEVMDMTKVWTPTLVLYTGYAYSDFEVVIECFTEILHRSEFCEFQNVKEKYAGSSYSKASSNLKLNIALF